jgi:hypothetical protein
MALYPASEKQVTFIKSLLDERVIPEGYAAEIREQISIFTSKRASEVISALMAAPRKPKGVAPVVPIADVLAGIPNAKYAIPAYELSVEALDRPFGGDILFVEVKEYMGRVYMRRLQGAPGAFVRSKIPASDVAVYAGIIKQDSYKYTRLFGEHYQCCGKCGAELTDEESRRLMLGPVCRKAFGR